MGRATRIGVSAAMNPEGISIDVTPHEAVAGDAALEAEIAMGAPVGEDGPTPQSPAPFQGHIPPPVARRLEGENDKLASIRQKYHSKPGAPIPYGLRTPEERARLRTVKDESKPPVLAPYQPPMPMAAAIGPTPRSFDELLKLTVKAAIDEDLDNEADLLRELQKDRKRMRESPPPTPPGERVSREG